ncbi:hypothetical protein TWF481_009105 [Arthrobotrys musiformis]|uniref:Uncharacterized protein n=1 Tax=Arthrobotrys musiformis TaxID=47236 RepID=A0AAV9W424_9PEZI
MKKQGKAKRGRGGSSSARTIRLSSLRPDSIPTSVLHRSDVDYNSLQAHLNLQDTEMHSVRTVLDTIIEMNPDFFGLNLRLTSERELLCRMANENTNLFDADISARLVERNRETGAVGWLLYQFILWCMEEGRRAAIRAGGLRERSRSRSNSGGSMETIMDIDPSKLAEMEEDDEFDDDDDDASDDEDDYTDDEGGSQDDSGEDSEEEDLQGGGEGFELGPEAHIPQHMIDSSDLERELRDYEDNIEPQMILRYGSAEAQREYLQRQGNGSGGHGIGAPDAGDSSDEEPRIDPEVQRGRRTSLFFAFCCLFLFLSIVILCLAQYMHHERTAARLWDSLTVRKYTITTPTEIEMTHKDSEVNHLAVTRANATIVKVEL